LGRPPRGQIVGPGPQRRGSRRTNVAMKSMKERKIFFVLIALLFVCDTSGNSPSDVDVKVADGTVAKATYFAAAKPGPGVLLFPQGNRGCDSWNDVANELAVAGINTLTVKLQRYKEKKGWLDAEDAAFEFLANQSGVN